MRIKKSFLGSEVLISYFYLGFVVFLFVLSFLPEKLYEPYAREDGLMENAEFLFYFLIAYFCIKIFFKRKKQLAQTSPLFLLAALIFLFGALEEISWGQRIIGFRPVILTNEANYQRELNLHNLADIGALIFYGSVVFLVLFAGILPLLTYFSKKIKKTCLRFGIPLMPKVIWLSIWPCVIFLMLIPMLNYTATNERAAFFELGEFYLSFTLFAYIFVEYFSFLKYNKPYDFERKKEKSYSSLVTDFKLVVKNNKKLIIVAAALIIIAPPLSYRWRTYRLYLDQQILYQDPEITIIEGEHLKLSNSAYWFKKRKGCFGDKHIAIYTDTLPQEGYIFFKYRVPVKKSGMYKIFLCGAPAGPKDKGVHDYFCPYELWIDGKRIDDVYEEKYVEFLSQTKGDLVSLFYTYYSYTPDFLVTKLGEFQLSKGEHEIEFRIYEKSLGDAEYKFYIDAIVLAPVGWNFKTKPFSLPLDLFFD